MYKKLTALILVACLTSVAAGFAQEAPEKALCSVCAVRGETELEKVKAESSYEGKSYYFCSADCKKEFELDPVAYVPAELPRPAPSFVVETLEGDDFESQFSGQVTLVDFWATWCKPCVKIMPELQRLHDQYADAGLQVLGVSVDEDDDRAAKVKKFIKKHAVKYPVFLDSPEAPAWHAYRVKAVPALFLIDAQGRIVAEWRGAYDHESLSREVARLMQAQDGHGHSH